MALTITFKDEDEQDGVPVGPVIVWDTGRPAAGPCPAPMAVVHQVGKRGSRGKRRRPRGRPDPGPVMVRFVCPRCGGRHPRADCPGR